MQTCGDASTAVPPDVRAGGVNDDMPSAAAVAGTWYPGTAARSRVTSTATCAPCADGPRGRIDADHRAARRAHVLRTGRRVRLQGGRGRRPLRRRRARRAVALRRVRRRGALPGGAFDSPLGPAPIDDGWRARLMASPRRCVHRLAAAHRASTRSRCSCRSSGACCRTCRIVPLLMGYQTRETIAALADALARRAVAARRALLVASTDLSHYFDARDGRDARSRGCSRPSAAFDPEGLLALFEEYPERERGRYVACGGGPAIAVMLAARAGRAPRPAS